MKYRTLGFSGLKVSELALGTMTFGGERRVRGVTVSDAQRIFDAALDSGVNLIDTADVYSDGESEEIVGEVIKRKRDDVILATKLRFRAGPSANDEGLSADHIISGCERSLRRLNTDHIDLLQFHGWDGLTDPHETLQAADILVKQGKVRHIGASNYSAWHLYATQHEAGETLPRLASQQIYYSLIGRDSEAELLPSSANLGLGTLVWSPLAGGLMTGKYRRNQPWPAGARHSGEWDEPPISDWEYTYDVIETLIDCADQIGSSPAQLALAYLLTRSTITSLIVGARSTTQLEDTLKAGDLAVPPEILETLTAASERPLAYPYWHQARTIGDRLSAADQIALRGQIERNERKLSTKKEK